MDHVILVSKEGKEVQVEKEVAKLCVTLKNLLEDTNGNEPIPLSDISEIVLQKIVDYCRYHYINPSSYPDEKNNICEWDRTFCQVEVDLLFNIILAANYLENTKLLDLACIAIANMIKGKSTQEIRTFFNIKNDFTAEEEKELEKENEFCE